VGNFNRIYVGEQIDQRLRTLKARTGLAPNLLCRIGFCLSIEEPGTPDPALYSGGAMREFNRYTLTGAWDPLFFALLRERLSHDRVDVQENVEEQFVAHISRGVHLLSQRVKNLDDLAELIQSINKIG
jgi:DNA sulfur modification protein DndE